ncbi:hypothetical protein DFH07DRAFT_858084 [Mycena maculata]|uniref:CASTOR ACT domain-containing protein n=1 Tax=Mycena maculata TaxID=230809 RepID=A0AAD7HJ64_9AGAR|nr:hypothetical protein DFH07DRAFT_858084 [Mycena maculata]
MQVTITRLPTAVSIVSIPRPRLDVLSHPLLRVLLQPAPAFLSITCNALELSLFADLDPESLSAFQAVSTADHASGSSTALDPVEISCDRWSVLQIDSHSDQLDNAGARVNELSAPLAAAGISILYQSSYMSDFIFVKEQHLGEAMGLFAAAGFALYAADPNLLTALLAPAPLPVLTRERSSSAPLPSTRAASKSSSRSGHSRAGSKGKVREKAFSTPTSGPPKPSASPVRAVRVLAPDLACVGLADDAADHWALKIVKLVAFPDLIPLPSPLRARPRRPATVDEDAGYFSHSPSPTIGEPDLEPDPGPEVAKEDENEHENVIMNGNAGVQPSRARPVPSRLDALPSPLAWLQPPDTDADPSVNEEPQPLADVQKSQSGPEPRIPFFSFTRTPEGSSLTAGARVLAALFPRAERHMVICAGELDAADVAADSSFDADSDADELSSPCDVDYDSDEEYESDKEDEMDGPLLWALQVDLRGAGLDTYGLVHRFSRALAKGGINHMYASTLRSANLLVPSGRGRRGARLLRGC